MHSKGVIGAQFLHSASSVLSIPERSPEGFSVFRVDVKTLPICFGLLNMSSKTVLNGGANSEVLNLKAFFLRFDSPS